MTDINPTEAGRAAYKNGQDLSANPYPEGSVFWAHWQDGWTAAERESYGSNG